MQPAPDKNRRKTSRALRMVIAGGGTGGHLFPGIAIAYEFMGRHPRNRVLFVGTGKPLEISALSVTGFNFERITAAGIKGRGWARQALSIAKIPKGIIESILILKRFGPDLVVGVGGYAAGPLVIGAWLLRIPIALHEQNMLPGITNRILFYFAGRVCVSFDNTRLPKGLQKVRVTGNPVRPEIIKCAHNQKAVTPADAAKKRPFTILIIGGSQGANSLNLAVINTMEYIKAKDAFYFIHQTGVQDETMVKDAYHRHGISGTVRSFFIDMARQYQSADMVICRAGATTVAEITAIGKGVLFVPFPHAADNHQVLNAQSLVNAGAAEMILQKDLNGKRLADRIAYYAANPQALDQLASKAKNFGRPDAAAMIVDDCYRLVNSSNQLTI